MSHPIRVGHCLSVKFLTQKLFCLFHLQNRYGRADAPGPEACSPEGNLPDGNPGPEGKFGGAGGTASTEATTPNEHLRKVFYRMGLNVRSCRVCSCSLWLNHF